MSNETDLDCLARNVRVWPNGAAFVRIHTNGQEPVFVTKLGAACGGKVFTRDQWLARRSELQNKPSWKAAPEWATHLVQITTGSWIWIDDERLEIKLESVDKLEYSGCYGEVLGDWRDTLEKRPADLSEPSVTQRLDEATQNVLAAVPELKSDKYKFDPFTSIEDNQEQEVKQDNGWFERGELPPVGARVNVSGAGLVYGDGEKGCEVLTHVEDTAVVRMSYGLGCFQAHVMSPSMTERELAIEEMCNVAGLDGLVFGLVAGKLYDAGYRKESK